jgi:hypothetical protein
MPKINLHRFYLILSLPYLLTACTTNLKTFYSSPFNGNTGDYQTIPLASDSVKSATYASIALWSGSANTEGHDYFNAFHMAVSRSHNLGAIQAWYGLGVTWGTFNLGRWYDPGNPANNALIYIGPNTVRDAGYLNSIAGSYYFGGESFSGGMNTVMPFQGGEWRFIGLETSLNHEIGNYVTVRKNMPDSAAALNVRSDFFGTLGLTTELVRKNKTGQFGWKWAAGYALGNNYQFLNIDENGKHTSGYSYFDFTFHWTYLRYTGFMQVNSATKAKAFHLGFNFRL